MNKLTVKEIMYLTNLLEKDGIEIQKDLDGGADKAECEKDLSANKSLIKKLKEHIGKEFY